MEKRPKSPVLMDHQESAHVLDLRLSEGRARRRAASRYARDFEIPGLSRRQMRKQGEAYLRSPEGPFDDVALTDPVERRKIDAIHDEFLSEDRESLVKKNYSNLEWAALIFKAKSNRNGLSKEEKVEMYEEAGFREKDIKAVTGKKMASSFGVTLGLTAVSEGVRFGGVVFDRLVPLVDKLPGKMGALLSAGGYTGSYVLFAMESRRLTEKTGASANASVTGMYAVGDVLVSMLRLPSRVRDVMAVGIPVATDAALHTAAYTAGVGTLTDNFSKITAGNLTSTALTLGFAGGSELWLRQKMKQEKKANKE